MRSSTSPLRLKPIIQVSRLRVLRKVVFLHGPGSGAACFNEEFVGSRPATTTSSSFRESSTRKLRHFTFPRSIRSPLSSLRFRQITKVSRLNTLFKPTRTMSSSCRMSLMRKCRNCTSWHSNPARVRDDPASFDERSARMEVQRKGVQSSADCQNNATVPESGGDAKTPGLTRKAQVMRHVMIREVLRGSLSTPGWQPKERPFPNCHSKTPRSRGGHPSCDGTADCGSVVTRHRAMADGTKRTSRDLGAASPEQKPARPASEVVRENPATKGRGPKCPAAQKLNGVVAGSSCSRIFPQQSFRLGLATLAHRLVDYSLFSPLGCGCHCATPFVRRVRCRSGSQTLQKRQRLFPCSSLFSSFFVPATHSIASPRSPGTGRLLETVKDLAVSPCPSGMGLPSRRTVHF